MIKFVLFNIHPHQFMIQYLIRFFKRKMATRIAMVAKQRLTKEYKALLADPLPGVSIYMDPKNIFTWYFVCEGHCDTIKGGWYLYRIEFPPEYPSKPPSIYLMTPNGFLRPNESICTSFTSWHPESYNPIWDFRKMCLGTLTFVEDLINGKEHSATMVSHIDKKVIQELAKHSLASTVKLLDNFETMFPNIYQKHVEQQQQQTGEQQ
eukprot:UN02940